MSPTTSTKVHVTVTDLPAVQPEGELASASGPRLDAGP